MIGRGHAVSAQWINSWNGGLIAVYSNSDDDVVQQAAAAAAAAGAVSLTLA